MWLRFFLASAAKKKHRRVTTTPSENSFSRLRTNTLTVLDDKKEPSKGKTEVLMVDVALTTEPGGLLSPDYGTELLNRTIWKYCCFFNFQFKDLFDKLDMGRVSVRVDLLTTDPVCNTHRALARRALDVEVFKKQNVADMMMIWEDRPKSGGPAHDFASTFSSMYDQNCFEFEKESTLLPLARCLQNLLIRERLRTRIRPFVIQEIRPTFCRLQQNHA